jgi:hypothetical protein
MLKPCIECGNKDIEITGEGFNARIECKCGKIRGGFSSKENLVIIWNMENTTE